MNITNKPPKGTADWMPEEYAVRKYIFDTWRKTCINFGYEEYLTPIVELADIYRAKSGEEVGGKELMVMTDKAGRELAIRPEMTPSVTRLVSRIYNDTPKPIRYFSIANFLRNEKPQRGRNREFWQLNFDIFGSETVNSDLEILQMGLEIMLAFGAKENMFKLYLNDRRLVEAMIGQYLQVPNASITAVARVIDRFNKVPEEQSLANLKELGAKFPDGESYFIKLMKNDDSAKEDFLNKMIENEGVASTKQLLEMLEKLGYGKYVEWNPAVIRGFDYYDGMVFEVYDCNTENARSLFGGGRYNGLAGIFGSKSFPAVGCAPGDETTKLFLQGWNLIPEGLGAETYYLPILAESMQEDTLQLAAALRRNGLSLATSLEEVKLQKALEYANKKQIDYVVIFGENEAQQGIYKVKNMQSGEEVTNSLN